VPNKHSRAAAGSDAKVSSSWYRIGGGIVSSFDISTLPSVAFGGSSASPSGAATNPAAVMLCYSTSP
jgi:hypothetical protein